MTDTNDVAVRTAATALDLPDSLDFDQWREIGRRVVGAAEASWWWVGDWLEYADQHFAGDGDSKAQAKIRQAVGEITNLDATHLTEMQRVARRYPPAARRRRLSWAHHARLVDAQGELVEQLLDTAEREGWSESQLATERRKWEATPAKPVEDAPVLVHLQVKVTVPEDVASELRSVIDAVAEGLRGELEERSIDGTVKVR